MERTNRCRVYRCEVVLVDFAANTKEGHAQETGSKGGILVAADGAGLADHDTKPIDFVCREAQVLETVGAGNRLRTARPLPRNPRQVPGVQPGGAHGAARDGGGPDGRSRRNHVRPGAPGGRDPRGRPGGRDGRDCLREKMMLRILPLQLGQKARGRPGEMPLQQINLKKRIFFTGHLQRKKTCSIQNISYDPRRMQAFF